MEAPFCGALLCMLSNRRMWPPYTSTSLSKEITRNPAHPLKAQDGSATEDNIITLMQAEKRLLAKEQGWAWVTFCIELHNTLDWQPIMPPRQPIMPKRTSYYASTAKKNKYFKIVFRRFWPFYVVYGFRDPSRIDEGAK